MLPQMTLTSSLAFVAFLMCFSFSVNQQPYNYSTASVPTSWTNLPSLTYNFELYSGETVRSLLRQNTHGLSFAAGFYCFPPCKSFFLSIYIISEIDDNPNYYFPLQVIWSANRARPVSENATLHLTSKDGLTLLDSDGSLVWSTNVMNRSVTGINITEAGNLVLFDINNLIIWQSFDHPTDCLVMGQTLEGGMRIIANSSSTDLAESQFYLTLLADGLYGFVNSNPPLEYFPYHTSYSTSNRTVDKSAFIKYMNGSLTILSPNLSSYPYIFEIPPAISIQYMRFESDGHLRVYDYDTYDWKMVSDLFNYMDFYMDNCDYPTVCGHYGICDNEQCTCPTVTGTSENYFKPVDNRRPELGCFAITNITCQDVKNHRLLDLTSISYFNTVDNNVAFEATEETCKKACLEDCKCKAALFQSSPFQSSNGNSSDGECLILQEVFSFKNQPDDSRSSAYIKG
ncbi:hypothetical protein FCM35_KLT10543 [Carex littledalei]|uniref:non-specific serine/threonine protein kinase n=1 Tax=Carex littledalei TaxID=544730 RepID=A0A833QTV1_9POAL|nr:hypothetical protein FCM35_KLT10543 [Carex littledalei]